MKMLRTMLLAITFATPAAASPLIANGSFETGDFTGWAQSGNTQYTSVFNQVYDGLAPQQGAYYALLGPSGSDGTLSQAFFDAPGSTLRISFWLSSDGGAPSDFSASYDGAALMHLANAGIMGWTEYTDTVTATGDDTLSFSFRDDQDYYALDDIAVIQDVAVPEPAGYFLLPLALVMLWGWRKAVGGDVPSPPNPPSFIIDTIA